MRAICIIIIIRQKIIWLIFGDYQRATEKI